jgi:EAL domain-containing protein (putative c-di-GMP-specific phosphodiesterase class I)
MTADETNAGLRRVLEALTAPEPATAADGDAPEMPPMPEHFDIDEALHNNWLEMWYQPKIDLRQKCLAGAEALARIRHPDYGVVLPASFVAGVDDDKLVSLTDHALRTTLRDWQTFDASGFNLRLAINLPVNHLFKLPISDIVDAHRPEAEHWPGLIVEVTEDQVVREIKRAQEIACILKVSGITVSIDDFGAGYSSFHSLRELAFTELKLNYSFVKNCATDATNAAICQTAIDLAHRFGSAAVAEGIESLADLQALQIMGCDFGQGILLAPPLPLPQFLSLLQQRMNRPRPVAPAEAAVEAAVQDAATVAA